MAHDYDRRRKTAEYKGDGQEFFELLDAEYNTVKYDAAKGTGWADAGSLGKIEFHESGNDPAVIMTLSKPPRFKARPETMMEIIEALQKCFNMSD